MPPAKQREDSGRQSIVESAATLFLRYGPHKTTIGDIARGAGMSQANIYNFFSGKNDIIEAVGQKILTEISHNITKKLRKIPHPRQKLEALFLYIHDYIGDNILPHEDFLRLELAEGIPDWQYARDFEAFVFRTTCDILSACRNGTQPDDAATSNHARAALDCMFFGTSYSRLFNLLGRDQYRYRVQEQIKLVCAALQALGYNI